MIRVTSGKAKNIILNTPEVPGFRSVQDVMKQSIFSIIGEKVNGSVCLDLFSGSGNLGIEALSRGAFWCDFVDGDRICTETINENLKKCKFENNQEATGFKVTLHDVVKYVVRCDKKYNIIFVDPFYETISHKFLVKNLEDILEKDGLVVFLHGQNLNINTLLVDTHFVVSTERRFGSSIMSMLVRKEDL